MSRKGLLVDTCALIAWADPSSQFHDVTRHYVEQAIRDGVPLYVSALSAAEFSCRQDLNELDLRTFILVSFDTPEAVLSGQMYDAVTIDDGDSKVLLKVDLMLIAHAEKLRVAGILTSDFRTLAKYCERLRHKGLTSVIPVLTSDPFDPVRVLAPASQGLPFSNPLHS